MIFQNRIFLKGAVVRQRCSLAVRTQVGRIGALRPGVIQPRPLKPISMDEGLGADHAIVDISPAVRRYARKYDSLSWPFKGRAITGSRDHSLVARLQVFPAPR